ncbi:MAG: Stealth CR1 domain-containing protein [Coraliomargaritaceae bacterium]
MENSNDCANKKPAHEKPSKIDVVFTWVDPENEEWQQAKEKAKIKDKRFRDKMYVHAFSQSRFNSNLEELKYALRSIERHMLLSVRKIFLVTNNGSVPDFIDAHRSTDPPLKIIDYRDLLGRETFCSRSIESVLHKIEGLTEYFLYFNDDMILNADLSLQDLINHEGKAIWYQDTNPFIRFFHRHAFFSNFVDLDGGVVFARHRMYRTLGLNDPIPPPIGHNPRLLNKTRIKDFVTRFRSEVETLRTLSFRSPSAFSFLDAYCYHYAHKQQLHFVRDKKTAILVQRNRLTAWLNRFFYFRPPNTPFICIADIRKGSAKACPTIRRILDKRFPTPSRWEK